VVTYPLLFAIGVSLTPWDKLVAAFNLPYVLTIVSTVVSIMATGLRGGRLAENVSDRHGNRDGLPQRPGRHGRCRHSARPPTACSSCRFAQIATRIGGAITVTLVLIGLTQIA